MKNQFALKAQSTFTPIWIPIIYDLVFFHWQHTCHTTHMWYYSTYSISFTLLSVFHPDSSSMYNPSYGFLAQATRLCCRLCLLLFFFLYRLVALRIHIILQWNIWNNRNWINISPTIDIDAYTDVVLVAVVTGTKLLLFFCFSGHVQYARIHVFALVVIFFLNLSFPQ